MAIAHRKLIYPLRISDDMPTGAIEYYLSGVQYKDLYIDYDAQLRALVSHIKSGDDLQSSIKPTTQVKTTSETVNAENEFTIIQCADIRQIEHLLEGSIAIDRQSYQDELVGIMDRCIEWYYANPEIYTFATDAAGRTIGYINAMPVEEEIYQRIRDGDYLDNEIPPEAIMQFAFPGEFDLYFCSIGVDAYYRNSRLFRVLFDAFISKITRWCDDGYFARRVISDAVTRDGLKMCNVIGCRKLTNSSHNSSIFELSMLPPEIKPTTATVRALISRYEVYGLV